METTILKCQGCGAGLERPASGNVVKYPYCHTEQLLPAAAAEPMRPEDIAAALDKARASGDQLMDSVFPGARILRALFPIIFLVIFVIAAFVILKVLFSMM
ncbi:MAG: hypothetical protein ACKO2G_00820 [Verrucomicrobiales bacterium]